MFLYVFVCFRLCGYRDQVTIKQIKEKDVQEIEKYVQSNGLDQIRSFEEPPPDEDLVYFFGVFTKTPEKFCFLPGEKKMIGAIVYASSNMNVHELAENEIDQGTDYYIDSTTIKAVSAYNKKRCEDLTDLLFKKMRKTVYSYIDEQDEVAIVHSCLVHVFIDEGQIKGNVVCPYCKMTGAPTTHSVSLKVEGKYQYWLLGNFTKHLNRVHKFAYKNKRNKKRIVRSNTSQRIHKEKQEKENDIPNNLTTFESTSTPVRQLGNEAVLIANESTPIYDPVKLQTTACVFDFGTKSDKSLMESYSSTIPEEESEHHIDYNQTSNELEATVSSFTEIEIDLQRRMYTQVSNQVILKTFFVCLNRWFQNIYFLYNVRC